MIEPTTKHVVFCLILALSLTGSAAAKKKHGGKAGKNADTASSAVLSTKYPTVEMHGGKVSADRSAGVIYLDARQREERRVVIKEGLVYARDGVSLVTTKGKHHNENNYVMDAAGNFYLFDEFTTPTIRHSSIFAGGPVAGAGNILIKEGRVTYVDSDSGHYPSAKVFANVLKELAERGVETNGISGGK